MYIYVWVHIYIHDYSLLWLGTHTYIYTWLLTPLVWYTHTYIYMTTHSSGLARGVNSHVYMCVCVPSQRSE
jgi:hypothetical protein